MKTLIFIRHAKSCWEQDVSDLQRPLNTRGFKDAYSISNAFKAHRFQPDAIYSSPANRAMTTCNVFTENLQWPKNLVLIEEQLYDFGGNQVTRFIKSLDNDLNKIILFGHNHAFTALANTFGDTPIDNLPTSGLAMINFDIERWQDLKKGSTQLILTPKTLE